MPFVLNANPWGPTDSALNTHTYSPWMQDGQRAQAAIRARILPTLGISLSISLSVKPYRKRNPTPPKTRNVITRGERWSITPIEQRMTLDMTTQDISEQGYFVPTAIQEYEERCRLEAAAARRLADQIPRAIAKADGKPIAVQILPSID